MNAGVTVDVTKFDVHSFDRKVIACKIKLPVIVAYAMTVHRSQGFDLDSVAIDFSSINHWRPNGLVYVALSRCRSRSGLWVRGLQRDFVQVSTRARETFEGIIRLS